MSWQHYVLFILVAVGVVGCGSIAFAFVLIAREGGWQAAIQKPIAERRWTPARRLMLVGAGLSLAFAVGITILGVIPGGLPWRD